MADNRTELLREQYEDALFTLLMDEYAEETGEKLLDEFNHSESAEMPADLDNECRKTIRQHFARQKNKTRIRKTLRFIGKSVATIVVVFGLASTLFFSVDAIRVPVLNFLLEHQKGYLLVSKFPESSSITANSQDNSPQDPTSYICLIPQGYELHKYTLKPNGTIFVYYTNEAGDVVSLQTVSDEGIFMNDTEDAVIESVTISGYEGTLIQKEGFDLVWHVPEAGLIYKLYASNLTRDEVLQIALAIAYQDDGSLLAGMVPEGYRLLRFFEKLNDSFTAGYKKDDDHLISLSTHRGNVKMQKNVAEGGEVKPIRICGYEGHMIIDNRIAIMWYVPETDTIYDLTTTDLELNNIWQIAEAIAEQCRESAS